jgi:hypothetical protein
MATKNVLSGTDNHEVKIYIDTAQEIFNRCIAVAELEDGNLLTARLADAINARIPNDCISESYLRNLRTKIRNAYKVNPTGQIGITSRFISVLAAFAGIGDYIMFNNSFNPDALRVLFTAESFKRWEIFRVVESGQLKQSEKNWIYTSDDKTTVIEGPVNDINIYTMPGDAHPLWLVINTEFNGVPQKVFFSSVNNNLPAIQTMQTRLYNFFARLA